MTTSVMRIDRALSRYGSRGWAGADAGAFGVGIMRSGASNGEWCFGTITPQCYGQEEQPYSCWRFVILVFAVTSELLAAFHDLLDTTYVSFKIRQHQSF